jgi:hypothetical protein
MKRELLNTLEKWLELGRQELAEYIRDQLQALVDDIRLHREVHSNGTETPDIDQGADHGHN